MTEFPRVIVLTSDKTLWSVRPLIHQWHKYTSQRKYVPLDVFGYTVPDDPYFMQSETFHSIGKFENYPVKKWSNGVIEALRSIHDDLVLVMMDDYWMVRDVDLDALIVAKEYMEAHPDIIRFDLTTDRLGDKHHDLESIGRFDIIQGEKGASYNFSMQASIYRRELMLEMLVPDEDPWEAELHGNVRLNASPYRVVGTRQWPMRYIVAVNKGVLMLDGSWCVPPRKLSGHDVRDLYDMDMIPVGVKQA